LTNRFQWKLIEFSTAGAAGDPEITGAGYWQRRFRVSVVIQAINGKISSGNLLIFQVCSISKM